MVDISEEIERMAQSRFFTSMGVNACNDENIILITDVKKAFVEPSDSDFQGLYKRTDWLPTSPAQDDPFYKKQANPQELMVLRKAINQCAMAATRNMDKSRFMTGPHDFSAAARNALCFAFRQLITERYFSLGHRWEVITHIYCAGHWPVGYAQHKIIAI
ncbi:DUF4942 domain-containing protein [Kosakonia sp. BK9b]